MQITSFNIIVSLVLLTINILLIYRSHRGKRFAYYSSKLFILIFSAYWITLLFYFQTFDFVNLGSTNPKGKKIMPTYETTYVIKTKYDTETKFRIEKLNKIMTAAVIQAILVIILSFCGII